MPRFLLSAFLLLALPFASDAAADSGERIRVRLLEELSPREVRVEAESALALYAGLDPLPLVSIAAGQSVRIVAEQERLRVEAPEMTFYTPQLRIGGTERAEDAAPFRLHAGGAAPLSRRYNGTLRVDPEGAALRLIHAVDIETYVAAVVTREYGLDDDEGTKAMAILARTYALHERGRLHTEYDVVDHVGSQVFFGLEGVSPRAIAAAEATRGQVLTWQGELARTVYSSSNGGHSASNQEVWPGEAVPYLQAHADPYDRVSPHTTWRTELPRDQVLRALSDAFGRGVSGFVVDARSAEGRVNTVTLQRSRGREQTVSGQQFRMTLSARFGVRSVRSTLFDVRRAGDRYVFEGRGFGHGVGMSQWGAHGQAKEGRTAEQILAFYYPGTRIDALPAVTSPALAQRAVAEDERTAPDSADVEAFESEPLSEPIAEAALPPVSADQTPSPPLSAPRTRPAPLAAPPEPAVEDDAPARPEGWTGPRTEKSPPVRRRGW